MLGGEGEIGGRGVLGEVIGVAGFGDNEGARPAEQEAKGDLPGSGAEVTGDGGQGAAAAGVGRGEVAVAIGAVGDQGGFVRGAPGQDGVFDGALLRVIEHLIADGGVERGHFIQVIDIEVADTPGEDLAGALELMEGFHGFGEGVAAAPVQQVAIQMVRLETAQRGFAGGDGAAAGGVVR